MSAHSSTPTPRLVISLSVSAQHAELFCTDEAAQTFVLTVDEFPQS
ncbi:hypothetical protein [Subtercola lobariae]|nr:hypothetical protein [Subtercola lobariae]